MAGVLQTWRSWIRGAGEGIDHFSHLFPAWNLI
jgi:hypothetical protein